MKCAEILNWKPCPLIKSCPVKLVLENFYRQHGTSGLAWPGVRSKWRLFWSTTRGCTAVVIQTSQMPPLPPPWLHPCQNSKVRCSKQNWMQSTWDTQDTQDRHKLRQQHSELTFVRELDFIIPHLSTYYKEITKI